MRETGFPQKLGSLRNWVPSKQCGKIKNVVRFRFFCKRVFAHSFLKKVGFSFDAYQLHEIKRIGRVIHLVTVQLQKQAVGNKFNVLNHQLGIHSNEATRQRFTNKLGFNLNRFFDNFLHARFGKVFHHFIIKQDCKFGMKRFVAGNQFVAERETGHQPAFFHPINRTKCA